MSLAKQPSLRSVAVLVESRDVYIQGLIRGIAQYSEEHGQWQTHVLSAATCPRLSDSLRACRVDGVLCWIDNRRVANAIVGVGVPAIDLCRSLPNMPFPTVVPDDDAVARLAADHLMERTFRHFGFVAAPRNVCLSKDARADRFTQIVREAGSSCTVFRFRRCSETGKPHEAEQMRLAHWISSLPKPLGLMACDDDRGIQTLDACRRIGVAVPNDVAIIGVGNDKGLCSLASTALSSVDLNVERIGYEAAQLLDRLMSGEPMVQQTLLVEPRGVAVRASSDILAVSDPRIGQAIRFICDHACSRICVADVARHTELSISALESRFKWTLGRSIHQEIRRIRMERVKELLLTTDLPLKQIAAQTGFYYVEYMMRAFRRTVGQTMRQYRRRMGVKV